MAYYQQYGQPQPRAPMGYGQAPPNYQSHMHAQQHGHAMSQPPHGQPYQSHQHQGGHGGHVPPGPVAPQHGMGLQQHLKRQASQLRTQYPDTRWCAVYVDVSTTAVSEQKDDFIDEQELLIPIPKTDTSSINLSLEESVMNDVMTWQDKDKEETKRREDERKDFEAKKEAEREAKEREENALIDDYLAMSGKSDRSEARRILSDNNWNMEEAVKNINFSSANIMSPAGGGGGGGGPPNYNGYNLGHSDNNNNNNNNFDIPPAAFGGHDTYGGGYGAGYGGSSGVSLKMVLPNNEQMTLAMEGTDTIWGLYAKLLQQRPEFSQKPFTFQLATGRKLQETDFDSTLSGLNLVPNGEVRVVY